MENNSKLFLISNTVIDNIHDYSIYIKTDSEIKISHLDGVRVAPKSNLVLEIRVPVNFKIKQLSLLDKDNTVEGVYLMLVDIDC